MVRGGGDPWETGGRRWRHEARGPREGRWSARRKADAVVRLLRGESLDELCRELGVEAHRLQAWRDEFLAGGIEGLKARPLQPEDRKLKEAERKIGELTLELEVWRPEKAPLYVKQSLRTPFRRRRTAA
jgi:transposase